VQFEGVPIGTFLMKWPVWSIIYVGTLLLALGLSGWIATGIWDCRKASDLRLNP